MPTPDKVQLPEPLQQYFTNDGLPAAGYKLFTYRAGTTEKIVTYTDSTGLTPNTNPIILDAYGRCRIWVPPDLPVDVDAVPPGPPGPQGPPGPPGQGNGSVLAKVKTVTSAELLDLINTPVEILPAPGAGVSYIVCGVWWQLNYGTVAYSLGGGVLQLQYGVLSGNEIDPSIADGLLTYTSDQVVPKFWTERDTATALADVQNTAVFLACDEPQTAGDGTLTLVVWYQRVPPPVNPDDLPSNSIYAVDSGLVEMLREISTDGTTINVAGGVYEFRDFTAAAYQIYHYQSNLNNPAVLRVKTGPQAGAFEVLYPCILEVTANFYGNAKHAPFIGQVIVSHTLGPDFYAQNAAVAVPAGAVDQQAPFSVSSGPLYVEAYFDGTDVWDGTALLSGSGSPLYNIAQITLTIKVTAVVQAILTTAITTAGINYTVGDTLRMNYNNYIKPLVRVTSVNGSGGVTGYDIVDPGLGVRVGSGFPFVGISPQPGSGSGFTMQVLTVTGRP